MNMILAPLRTYVVLAALALGGCATLSERDCRQGNWSDIGFEDGRQGHAENRFSGHVKACAKYGITPDRPAYFSARDEGLHQYCTPENGFEVGRAGGAYEGVCPREKPIGILVLLGLSGMEFEDAYALGQDVYSAQAALDSVEARIADVDKRLSKREGTPEERETARRQRDELEHERDIKKGELKRAERKANRSF
jgi:hypothetical protein